jgi:hypothetical protein
VTLPVHGDSPVQAAVLQEIGILAWGSAKFEGNSGVTVVYRP